MQAISGYGKEECVEREQFLGNCSLLIQYNPTGTGTYKNHQIKAVKGQNELVLTDRWDGKNWESSALRSVHPRQFTKLKGTVPVIRNVYSRVINELQYWFFTMKSSDEWYESVGQYLKGMTAVAISVCQGIGRFGATYKKHYEKDRKHQGMVDLDALTAIVDDSLLNLAEMWKVLADTSMDSCSTMALHFIEEEKRHFHNLRTLASYDPAKTENYDAHKISRLKNEKKLTLSNENDLRRWTGALCSVDETIEQIEIVVEQAKKRLGEFHNTTIKAERLYPDVLEQYHLEAKLTRAALEGVARIGKTYFKCWQRKPKKIPSSKMKLEAIVQNSHEWLQKQTIFLELHNRHVEEARVLTASRSNIFYQKKPKPAPPPEKPIELEVNEETPIEELGSFKTIALEESSSEEI